MKGQKGFVCINPPTVHKSLAKRALGRIARWYQLSQERAFLREIGDATLKDLGLSRADVHTESLRTFWDDPQDK